MSDVPVEEKAVQKPTAAEEFSKRSSRFGNEMRNAGHEFISFLMRLPARIAFSGPMITVLSLSAAYATWHHFYPAAAERNGELAQSFVTTGAETLRSWVGALKIS